MLETLIPYFILFLQTLIGLLQLVLFISALMSWFAGPTRTTFGMYIESIRITLTRPFRFVRIGMFDLSLIAAYIVLGIIENLMTRFLLGLA